MAVFGSWARNEQPEASDVDIFWALHDPRQDPRALKWDLRDLSRVQLIECRIYLFRSQKVMIDFDLAVLYGVTTSLLNKQVTRNRKAVSKRLHVPTNKRRGRLLAIEVNIAIMRTFALLKTDSLVKVDSANRLTPVPSEFKLLLFSGDINAAFAIFKHKMKSQRRPGLDGLSAAVE